MARNGTMLFCIPDFESTESNEIILNIVTGVMRSGNIMVLARVDGEMRSVFDACGVSVKVGEFEETLPLIRDLFLVICSGLSAADIVIKVDSVNIPVLWIIPEWCTQGPEDVMFAGRACSDLFIALNHASHVVFLCDAQRALYSTTTPTSGKAMTNVYIYII